MQVAQTHKQINKMKQFAGRIWLSHISGGFIDSLVLLMLAKGHHLLAFIPKSSFCVEIQDQSVNMKESIIKWKKLGNLLQKMTTKLKP